MAYLVKLTGRAERDLEELYEAIAAESSAAALRWYEGLKRAVLSLEDFPLRCPPTPEDKRLRHLLYGHKPHVYRVIFQVQQKGRTVYVLHIRHGARDEFSPESISR
jgi:plasmid stabilization system protein ParE